MLASGLAKQVAQLLQLCRLLRIAVEHCHYPVLHHCSQPHVEHALAQRDAKLACLLSGSPRLGHQIGSQQMRQNRRVDLVRLNLGVGDRLHLQWMRQHHIVADVVQPVVHHHPVAGGFHNRVRVLPIPLQKAAERLTVVLHPPGPQCLSGRVLNNQVAVAFVVIDPNVIIIRCSHALSPFIEFTKNPSKVSQTAQNVIVPRSSASQRSVLPVEATSFMPPSFPMLVAVAKHDHVYHRSKRSTFLLPSTAVQG